MNGVLIFLAGFFCGGFLGAPVGLVLRDILYALDDWRLHG